MPNCNQCCPAILFPITYLDDELFHCGWSIRPCHGSMSRKMPAPARSARRARSSTAGDPSYTIRVASRLLTANSQLCWPDPSLYNVGCQARARDLAATRPYSERPLLRTEHGVHRYIDIKLLSPAVTVSFLLMPARRPISVPWRTTHAGRQIYMSVGPSPGEGASHLTFVVYCP